MMRNGMARHIHFATRNQTVLTQGRIILARNGLGQGFSTSSMASHLFSTTQYRTTQHKFRNLQSLLHWHTRKRTYMNTSAYNLSLLRKAGESTAKRSSCVVCTTNYCTEGEEEVRKRARLEALERLKQEEVLNLFEYYSEKCPDGTRIASPNELQRMFVAMGFERGSNKLVKMMQNVRTMYPKGMAFSDFHNEAESFIPVVDSSLGKDMESELHEAFNVYDRDNSGHINAYELLTMLSTAGSDMTLEQAQRVIDVFDKNGDGGIDFDEFVSVLAAGIVSWRFRTGYRVIFAMGGPGSGKGTLSQRLMRVSGVGHISTGEMLRDEVEAETKLGLEVAKTMSQGQLVEPHIVMRMLREYLQTQPGKRVIIDGFPRTVQNAMDFAAVCGMPEFAVWFDAPDEVLIKRLLKRGEISGRVDDNYDTIKKRLEVYHSVLIPLKAWLEKNNVPIYRIDASKPVAEVEAELLRIPELGAKSPKLRNI
eukprot:CFRG4991T1